jgi:hypothetical protein
MSKQFRTGSNVPSLRDLEDLATNPHVSQWYRDVALSELRTLEGRRHSEKDQAHLDTAGKHAVKILDALHSAGARVPGTSQRAEADIERQERAASYAPVDSYGPHLSALKAASATPEQTFEARYKAESLAKFEAEWQRFDEVAEEFHASMRTAAAAAPRYPIQNSYEADLKILREREQRAAEERKR